MLSNYLLIVLLCIVDYFQVINIFNQFLGGWLFYDIPKMFDPTGGYAYQPLKAVFFIFHLSIVPFLLGFIKNKKILVSLMVIYLIIESIYIASISIITGL